MPANGRLARQHDFFFSPRDYLNDPAVLVMNLLARGGYSTLLFALWDQPEPGVAPDNDTTLAALARATAEEWAQIKGSVKGAFDTLSRPGWWVQKRMVGEHQRQNDYYSSARRLGKAGGLKSARLRNIPRDPQGTLKSASTASPASSASSAKEESITHSPASPNGSAWRARFDGFWRQWPKKEAKKDALKAWGQIAPKDDGEDLYRKIVSGIEVGRESDRWRRGIIPHPATWLRGARWNDETESTDDEAACRLADMQRRLAEKEATLEKPHA